MNAAGDQGRPRAAAPMVRLPALPALPDGRASEALETSAARTARGVLDRLKGKDPDRERLDVLQRALDTETARLSALEQWMQAAWLAIGRDWVAIGAPGDRDGTVRSAVKEASSSAPVRAIEGDLDTRRAEIYALLEAAERDARSEERTLNDRLIATEDELDVIRRARALYRQHGAFSGPRIEDAMPRRLRDRFDFRDPQKLKEQLVRAMAGLKGERDLLEARRAQARVSNVERLRDMIHRDVEALSELADARSALGERRRALRRLLRRAGRQLSDQLRSIFANGDEATRCILHVEKLRRSARADAKELGAAIRRIASGQP